jgi:hypothetical protein
VMRLTMVDQYLRPHISSWCLIHYTQGQLRFTNVTNSYWAEPFLKS